MEDKTFKLIEKMYSELIEFKEDTNRRFDTTDKKFDTIDERFDDIDKKINGLENEFTGIKQSVNKTNMILEHDLMPKITVLFDGHIQNTQLLERIESTEGTVNRHEDIIIRKVK